MQLHQLCSNSHLVHKRALPAPRPAAFHGPAPPCHSYNTTASTHPKPQRVNHKQQANPAHARKTSVIARTQAGGQIDSLRAEVAELEAERDEATAKAESCGKTGKKLEDIIRLLDEMALQKMKNDDEAGARAVLVEKANVKDALKSNAAKASANAALVQKLIPIITYKRQKLPPETTAPKRPAMPIWPPPPSFPSTPSAPPQPSSPYQPPYAQPQYGGTQPYTTAARSAEAAAEAAAAAAEAGAAAARAGATYSAPSASKSAYSSPASQPSYTGTGYGDQGTVYDQGPTWPQPKWQQSLEEARARLRAEEAAARESGRTARLSAEESISAAQSRIHAQAEADLQSGLQRVRAAQLRNIDSIAEAKQRIQEQDRQVLAMVQDIMSKYRRGNYVTEEELEFAFQQLERRFTA